MITLAVDTVTAVQRRLPAEIRPLALAVPVHYEAAPAADVLAEGFEPDILGLFTGDPHGLEPLNKLGEGFNPITPMTLIETGGVMYAPQLRDYLLSQYAAREQRLADLKNKQKNLKRGECLTAAEEAELKRLPSELAEIAGQVAQLYHAYKEFRQSLAFGGWLPPAEEVFKNMPPNINNRLR